MLIQYAVENYKSIKEEVVINFSVDKKYKESEWIIANDSMPTKLYNCIGLLGPNASGKSNIIESFMFSQRFILNTIKRKDSSGINVKTFAYDEEMSTKPTSFEFIFYQDKIKYIYGFSINNKEVLEEYLMGYFSIKPKTLFERSIGQIYKFKGNDEKVQKEISKKTNANRLYLPVAAEWGYEPLKKVYEWFELNSRQYDNYNINHMISEIIKNDARKKLLIKELRKADFNIKDIYVKEKKIDQKARVFVEKILNEFVGDIGEVAVPETNPVIRIVHENCKGKEFDIDLDEDSAGTESIVENIAEFLYLSEKGGLMLEDELGKTYHTRLTQHFLEMFKSKYSNPGDLQLLFTTHNTKILNILNPDQIYLVDKDEEGGTFVKLLDDYIIRANDNIELGYLKGRFGGIPYMKG